MSISANAFQKTNNTLRLLSQKYGSDLSKDGFFISNEKIMTHSKNCFSFWDFAKNINVVTVEDRQGESFLGTLGNPVSSRTDVSLMDRQSYNLLSDKTQYSVSQVNTDVHVPYRLLNMWAASTSQDFSKAFIEYIQKRVGTDRLIIGWHGKGSEQTTDPEKDPLLTNVAKGWLENVKEQRPDRVLASGAGESIIIGDGVITGEHTYHFKNLDEAVLAAISQIPSDLRDDLVCLIGDELLAAEQAFVYKSDGYLYEKHKNPDVFNTFGNIPRLSCVGFPAMGLVVTKRDNLSLYIKSGTAFRKFQDNIRRERIEDYQTAELAYVVENPMAFFAFEPSAVVTPELLQIQVNDRPKALEAINKHAANIE